MKMELTSATGSLKNDLKCEESMVGIRIITETDLMCEELIIDVPLVMEPTQWPECCIYRVPKNLRQINKEAYSPKLISIGPFYHGKEEVREMEKLKVRYLKDFCYRTGEPQKEIAWVIEENEVKLRRCYEEIFDISSEDFVKMVLLDSTFIIELFLRANDKKDSMSSKPLLNYHIQADLILLENQLPFFILEELHKKFSKKLNSDKSFFMLASNYFTWYIKNKLAENNEVKHFTDLIRYSYHPIKHNIFRDRVGIRHLCTAKKLSEAGVIFKLYREGGPLDIEFVKPHPIVICPCFTCSWPLYSLPCLKFIRCLERMQTLLKIPSFEINDGTESLLRNIMALEQCHYPREAYVCNYMVLLGYLIKTGEDVELLVEKHIIVNEIGSNEAVATVVNRLSLEIFEENSCYTGVGEDLKIYYYGSCKADMAQHCSRNMGYLRSTYFPTLWRGTATVVGLIVFGFTFWSTIKPYLTHQMESIHSV